MRVCHNCRYHFDEELEYCPDCGEPTPAKRREIAENQ